MEKIVYHKTPKENLIDILKGGLKIEYRNNKIGYTQTNSVINVDAELDNIAEKYFKNKPKRNFSNFAWLLTEHLVIENFPNSCNLEICVDTDSVYVSSPRLWFLCKQYFKRDYSDFLSFALVYWKNVTTLSEYLSSKKDLKIIDGLNQKNEKMIQHIWNNNQAIEIMMPYDIPPYNIKKMV